MEFLTEATFYVGLFAATVRLSAPLLLAALGETVAERAGVLNIGLEGMMLLGAWAGFVIAHYTGSSWAGFFAGLAIGLAAGGILAFLAVTRRANQIIVGIAINLFALGFSSFVFRELFPSTLPSVEPFQAIHIPLLSRIPYVGPVLFSQTWVVYLAFLFVPVFAFALYKTQWGLAVRAAGETPAAVDAAGVDVVRVRYSAALIGGAFAGLAGAALSVGQLSQFSENLSGGRGFFALAIVLVGRWDPVKVFVVTILFALGDALQLRLQLKLGIPSQFLQMIPFIVAIILTTGLLGRSLPPRALGQPYVRD